MRDARASPASGTRGPSLAEGDSMVIGPDTADAAADPHTHDWRLRAISHEDAHAVEEYRCAGCGEVTFR